MSRSRVGAILVPLLMGVALLVANWATSSDVGDPVGDERVALSALPQEATDTWRLIESGGPFPHDRDDIAFGNFEGLLPQRPSGYYREYTVETPGVDHRGARRLIVGDEGELYYTGDHYESFTQVDPDR